VSIVGPFTFFAAFIHLFADMMKLPYAPAVSRIAGAIVSALKPPPDGSYCTDKYLAVQTRNF